MTYLYLKFADEAAWLTARDALVAAGTVFVDDVLGTVWHQGATEADPPIARPGWCVNLVVDGIAEVPAVLVGALVNPVQPKRVFCGIGELSMPEALPEAGGTALVKRDIGRAAPDEVIARIERVVLRGRLTTEQAANRIARISANLAIVDARETRAQARQARDAAIAAVLAADAKRDALVAERDAQTDIRTQAIAQLVGLTGAARLPVVAVRDAATAELARIVPLLTEANAAIAVARDARDAVVAVLAEVNSSIVSLRATRDALRING